MSQVNRTANHCDMCGHEWLSTSGVVYTHCTSGKCRSRRWDHGGDLMQKVRASADSVQSFSMDEAATLHAIASTTRKPHDAATCRVYRCGICKELKANA